MISSDFEQELVNSALLFFVEFGTVLGEQHAISWHCILVEGKQGSQS